MSEDWDGYWSSGGLRRRIIEWVRKVHFAKAFAGAVRNEAPEGRVLEAGCGSGMSLAYLNDKATTFGVDSSSEALERARGNCRFAVACDIRRHLPFRDGSFDLVFNQGVMEHFEAEEFTTIVREFKRVSGRVLIILPGNLSIFRLWNPFEELHGTFYSRKDLHLLMTRELRNVRTTHLPRAFFSSVAGYGER
jgi:SAM-dependent methyltransferase